MQMSIHEVIKVETETHQQDTGTHVRRVKITSKDWKGNKADYWLTLFADAEIDIETVENIY